MGTRTGRKGPIDPKVERLRRQLTPRLLNSGRGTNWQTRLSTNLIKWLLEPDNPSVRYWTLRDIMDKSERHREVVAARKAILGSREAQLMFSKIGDLGGPHWSAGGTKEIYYSGGKAVTLAALSFLADLGLGRDNDPLISEALEFVLGYQRKNGSFKHQQGPLTWQCATADALHTLARFELSADERVQKGFEWLAKTQRLDGGWYCATNTLPGWPKEKQDSCPMFTLDVLRAYSAAPELQEGVDLGSAIEFLLRHWETKKPIPRGGPKGEFGIGSRWSQIRYPVNYYGYHLLKYLDVLSRYPRAREDARFKEALDLLLSKHDSQGRFVIEWPFREGWEEFEFGSDRKNQPSKWCTLTAVRILKRVIL